MEKITTVGLDIAKHVFHAVLCDGRGKEVGRRRLKRGQVLSYFAQLPSCVVGLEACGGAHEWGRRLREQGHEVRLIAPQRVKAYLSGNKNDYNDARAIAEAVSRPGMRLVSIKTVEQQAVQALHRLRAGRVAERTGLANQLRGLLAEYGMVLPRGVGMLRRRLAEVLEDGENGLSEGLRRVLARGYRQLLELDGHIAFYTRELQRHAREHEAVQRLQTVPGFGPVVASAFFAQVGHGEAYRRGRDVSAALGLVPAQHSSGGKPLLLGISKRGDAYTRSLLVHGARSVVRRAGGKDDPLSRWVNRLVATRGVNKATVALANKLARIGWAVLRHATVYQPA